MTLEQLDRWLNDYGRAWERQDTDAFVDCFTDDAVYCWGPWDEPLRGIDKIRAKTAEKVAEQDDIHFGHGVLAITPDGRGIARWWVSLRVKGEHAIEENEGIFLVTLDESGKCTDFREWWNSRTHLA